LDIYTSIPFQLYKELFNARCFDPCNCDLSFRESRRTPKSHFWECEWRPHNSLKVGLRQLAIPKIFIKMLFIQISNLLHTNSPLNPHHFEKCIFLIFHITLCYSHLNKKNDRIMQLNENKIPIIKISKRGVHK